MSDARATRVTRGEPGIRLFMSDGSERSTYMPQAQAVDLLGAPHAGVNLMACYYPKQTYWPERRMFGPDVPHFRHSIADQTEQTRLADMNEWTDGYYSFEIDDPDTEPLQQIADVRRYGQDARLTVTADLDTPDEDLERMADALKGFGRIQLRLNHEANGCTWFRFARNVGNLKGDEARAIYQQISAFFVRAYEVFARVAPQVTFVACFNGPGELVNAGDPEARDLPQLSADNLGPMYMLPGIVCSLDQYGSLHYGWPGHAIEDPPVIGPCDAERHKAFALSPRALCEDIFSNYRDKLCAMRGEQVRIDLGEMNFDEDIHGPDIQTYLVHECYDWVRRNPEIIGSVTFYELTDRGGLGLFRQADYGDLEDLTSTALLDLYRRIMAWPEFAHPIEETGAVEEGTGSVELVWRSACEAEGLSLAVGREARAVEFADTCWRHVIIETADGPDHHVFTDTELLALPPDAQTVRVFCPPPDGRDNSADGYRVTVPVPQTH